MRLDLFLKASRLILRRTIAQEICDAGAVRVNGSAAKSSKEIKVGDEITLRFRGRIIIAKVLTIPVSKQVSKSQASTLIEITGNEPDPSANPLSDLWNES
jgi:ribosomal 50S subunit-recycling heat shock protein